MRPGCCVLSVCLAQMWPAERLHMSQLEITAVTLPFRPLSVYHRSFLQSHLIQQDDLWCFEDGPGDSDPLFLSSTQLQASFAHLRIITCQRKIQGGGKSEPDKTKIETAI